MTLQGCTEAMCASAVLLRSVPKVYPDGEPTGNFCEFLMMFSFTRNYMESVSTPNHGSVSGKHEFI